MSKSIFYHAGCSVCESAEHDIVNLVGAENIDIVNIGVTRARIAEAELAGVKSVPALATGKVKSTGSSSSSSASIGAINLFTDDPAGID